MKKTLIVVAMAGLFGLPGLASAADGKLVFALVPKNMNNPFFDQARDGCKKAEKESGGKFECRYIGPGEHGGGDEQVKVVQDLITAKVNGIAVAPSNAPAMAKVLERAKAAGIPVTTWDSDLLPKDKGLRTTYVGTKNYDIGVNLAKIAMKLKPKGGTICIQSGGPAAANHNERMKGIRDIIAGKVSNTPPPGDRLTGQNGWKEVDGCPLYTNDDFPLSVTQMGEILAKYPDLTAFVPTGGFPQFVPNAYKQVVDKNMERIKSKKTILVVADTLPMQMDLMKAGYSHGQVGQRPFDMGYKSMFVLKDLVDKKKVADPIYTGLDVCEPDTAATCIAK
jgi:ribose transport system substrate-binding protein